MKRSEVFLSMNKHTARQKIGASVLLTYWLMPIFASLAVTSVAAQQHYNAWFRATLSLSWSDHLKWDHELQHRRQNGYGNENLMDRNLMWTYRMWLQYQRKPHWRFAVSPIGYFNHYKIIQTSEDAASQPVQEYRIAGSAEWHWQGNKRLGVLGRGGLEYRMFHDPRPDMTRFRLRWGMKLACTDKIQIMVFDEVFIQPRSPVSAQHFDHNRAGVQVEYRIGHRLRMDMGWMHITRNLQSPDNYLYESNFFVHVLYSLALRRGDR